MALTTAFMKEPRATLLMGIHISVSTIRSRKAMTVEIQIPSVLKLGAGSFAEVPAVLTRLGGKCPLIVTDAFLMSRGLPQKLQALIQETGIQCGIFSETVPDPTTEVVTIGVRAFVEGKHDSLVSLG